MILWYDTPNFFQPLTLCICYSPPSKQQHGFLSRLFGLLPGMSFQQDLPRIPYLRWHPCCSPSLPCFIFLQSTCHHYLTNFVHYLLSSLLCRLHKDKWDVFFQSWIPFSLEWCLTCNRYSIFVD